MEEEEVLQEKLTVVHDNDVKQRKGKLFFFLSEETKRYVY